MRPRIALALALALLFAGLALDVAESAAVHHADEWAVRPRDARPLAARPGAVDARERRPFPARLAARPRADPDRDRPLDAACVAARVGAPLRRRLPAPAPARRPAARRSRGRPCWLVGNAAEALTKHALERPALYAVDRGSRIHVLGFDHSYPSGHALRAVLLAGLVAALCRGFGAAAAVWAAVALPLLLLAGFHTPSDLVGGVLLAGLLIALVPLARRDTARS